MPHQVIEINNLANPMTKPKHIGIAACSAEGASLCYRTICTEAEGRLGPHAHPEITMHTPSLAAYVAYLEAGDMDGVADLMLASAEKLAAVGADFVICPDNTIHQAFGRMVDRSPLPWLHIANVVAEMASTRGFTKLGVTGTKWLVDSGVYPTALTAQGLDYMRPDPADRDHVDRMIMEELVKSRFHPGQRRDLDDLITRMKAQGCDAVILGCTELPLVIPEDDAPLPTLDSTRLLARAALDRALT